MVRKRIDMGLDWNFQKFSRGGDNRRRIFQNSARHVSKISSKFYYRHTISTNFKQNLRPIFSQLSHNISDIILKFFFLIKNFLKNFTEV